MQIKNYILNIAIIISLLIFGALSYYTYHTYIEYTKTQDNAHLSGFVEEIDKTLNAIIEERVESSIYLSGKEQSTFRRLVSRRAETDNNLKMLNNIIHSHDFYSPFKIYIEDTIKALQSVREEVDSLSPYYQDILIQRYHNLIFTPFLELLEETALMQKDKEIKMYLTMNMKYTILKENTVLENTYILFFLNSQKAINSDDLQIWNKLINQDTVPTLEPLGHTSIASHIKHLMSPEAFENFASSERAMILNQAKRGIYSVSTIGWSTQIEPKMEYYKKVHSILINKIKELEIVHSEKSQKPLIVFSISLLVIILILIKLLMLYKKNKQTTHVFQDTLRDIELVFTKAQQKEIQRLIENGKIDHIYKFLIQAIKDANTTKDLFLASMSHEIRTPLNGILGFTQLLKESDEKEEQKEFIAVIEKSSANLLTIVNDILDLSKIKAEKIELEMIEFDPVDSFESAVESYAAKAAEEDIDFNIFLDPTLPSLLVGDPTKISQIIVNLISNAVKFTPKNGEVNVKIEKLAEIPHSVQIKFSVKDTGIGITDAQKKNIFEAFTQADVSTSRKYGGTGLGLSISGKFAELMGGKLEISSEPNEGSIFYFTLELNKSTSSTLRDIPNLKHFTVGILEPYLGKEYIFNKNLEAYISATGAKIIHYTNESILSLHKASKLPDVIFIDHKSRLRQNELEKFIHFNTKIIVMSTGDQKRNLKHHQSHIDRVLYKPVNLTKTLKMLSDKEETYENEKNITFENVHILVAEDNLINQKLILNVLNRIGIEVTLANNGKEALDYRMQEQFDMIFMDVEMPVMGGMEATGKIINYEKHSGKTHIPIVTLTANALSGDREKYIGAGMDSYLSKPIELATLHKILRKYFEDRIVHHVT